MKRIAPIALLPLFVLAQLCPGRASAQSMRTLSVVTNTGEAHDVARFGEDTLVATDGGLVVLRGDATQAVLSTRAGMPGARLRSVSVVGDEVYVGGVEGLVVLRRDEEGALTVARRLPLRRIRRVLRFGDILVALDRIEIDHIRIALVSKVTRFIEHVRDTA